MGEFRMRMKKNWIRIPDAYRCGSVSLFRILDQLGALGSPKREIFFLT